MHDLNDLRPSADRVDSRTRRLPPWLVLASLPVAFVVMQLGSSVMQGVAMTLLVHAGLSHTLAQSYSTLVGMAAGSLLLLLVTLVVPLTQSLKPIALLGFRSARPMVFVWAALGTVALSPLADVLMGTMARFLPDRTLGTVPMLHELAKTLPIALVWPVFAVLPGIAEEAFFRGLLLRSFDQAARAVLVSGACFALFHVDPHHVVGVLPLGLFLSWVGFHHGLWVTMVAHVVNNTLAVVTIHISKLDVGYGTDTPMPLWWLPAGLALWLACVALLRTARQPQD